MLEHYLMIAFRNVTRNRLLSVINIVGLDFGVTACLGMLGLSTFVVERRVKEVGVRFVLGANVRQVTFGILRNLSVPVIISALLAAPISYRIGLALLEPFAYRMDLEVWLFVVGGMVALALANLTALWQVLRVTRANPVDALRVE